jgi:hypothetical protein
MNVTEKKDFLPRPLLHAVMSISGMFFRLTCPVGGRRFPCRIRGCPVIADRTLLYQFERCIFVQFRFPCPVRSRFFTVSSNGVGSNGVIRYPFEFPVTHQSLPQQEYSYILYMQTEITTKNPG